MECNIFKNVWDNDCSNVTTIQAILKAIKSGRWKEKIEIIRTSTVKAEIQRQKNNLPAAIFSGVFQERVDDGIVQYSQMMIIDIDDISQKKLKRLREQLKNNPWIYAYFAGPSKGVKILIKLDISNHLDQPINKVHYNAFISLEKEFSDLYGINIDKSGKNLSRLCFVSYDPEAYVNKESTPYSFSISELDEFISVKSWDLGSGVPIDDAIEIFDRCVKMIGKSKTGIYHKGNRNNFIFSLSCLLCEYGISPIVSFNLISERYQSLSPKEINSTVESAYKRNLKKFSTKIMTKKGNQKNLF